MSSPNSTKFQYIPIITYQISQTSMALWPKAKQPSVPAWLPHNTPTAPHKYIILSKSYQFYLKQKFLISCFLETLILPWKSPVILSNLLFIQIFVVSSIVWKNDASNIWFDSTHNILSIKLSYQEKTYFTTINFKLTQNFIEFSSFSFYFFVAFELVYLVSEYFPIHSNFFYFVLQIVSYFFHVSRIIWSDRNFFFIVWNTWS